KKPVSFCVTYSSRAANQISLFEFNKRKEAQTRVRGPRLANPGRCISAVIPSNGLVGTCPHPGSHFAMKNLWVLRRGRANTNLKCPSTWGWVGMKGRE
ncbi:unnamed protein product, partial [Gulo gulo]